MSIKTPLLLALRLLSPLSPSVRGQCPQFGDLEEPCVTPCPNWDCDVPYLGLRAGRFVETRGRDCPTVAAGAGGGGVGAGVSGFVGSVVCVGDSLASQSLKIQSLQFLKISLSLSLSLRGSGLPSVKKATGSSGAT